MTTIAATPNPSTGSVDLVITKTTDVTKVVRTNVNGSEEVRASAGQIPSTGTGTIVLTDYEASNGVNSYNAYLGPEVRTNHVRNPQGTSATNFLVYTAGTGETGTSTYVTGASDGPDGLGITTYGRRSVTAPKTAGSTGWTGLASAQRNNVSGVAGDTITSSLWVRYTGSNATTNAVYRTAVYTGGTSLTFTDSSSYTLQSGVWTRLSSTVTATGTFDSAGAWAYQTSGFILPTGATFDVTGYMIEKGSTVGTYFDGATADTEDVNYAWTGTANASTSTQTIENSFVTTSATLEITKPWLSVPVMPQYSEQVDAITNYNSGRASSTTVHRPLGRADNLVVMGKLGDRTGNLEIFCNTYSEARTLERVFERGEVVQLRQTVPELDMYFTVTAIPVSPYSVEGAENTRWAMTIDYVEVRRPIGDLAGALGWTFDELASSFVSFNAVTPAFTNFDALTLGDANV